MSEEVEARDKSARGRKEDQAKQAKLGEENERKLPWSVVLRIRGKVQGVFYRASTVTAAERIGVFGYAQNMTDGSVEVLAQGTKENVEEMIAWCQRGPPMATVTSVEQTAPLAQVARAKRKSFYIQRTGVAWKEEAASDAAGSRKRDFTHTKSVPSHPLDDNGD